MAWTVSWQRNGHLHRKQSLIPQAGWVKPGQMTALMGVSGAGKVPKLNYYMLLY